LGLPKLAKAEEEGIAGNSANPTTATSSSSEEFQVYSIVPDPSEALNPELVSLEVSQKEKSKKMYENLRSILYCVPKKSDICDSFCLCCINFLLIKERYLSQKISRCRLNGWRSSLARRAS
jgi:hypothetical protein